MTDFPMDAILITIQVASFSTAISFAFSVLLAYVMSRRNIPGRRIIDSLCTLPIVLPRGTTNGRAGKTGDSVDELLARFEIAHLADNMPGRISGGQKQRVALARAKKPGRSVAPTSPHTRCWASCWREAASKPEGISRIHPATQERTFPIFLMTAVRS